MPAKEGHDTVCKGKEIDETGFTFYCYTCDDDVKVKLIK